MNVEKVYPDSHPNRIYVKLPKDDDELIELGRPNYDVMETDYENYSVGEFQGKSGLRIHR